MCLMRTAGILTVVLQYSYSFFGISHASSTCDCSPDHVATFSLPPPHPPSLWQVLSII